MIFSLFVAVLLLAFTHGQPVGGINPSSCFEPQATPSCSNDCVADCVCRGYNATMQGFSLNPSCCIDAWDASCVLSAYDLRCVLQSACPSLYVAGETLVSQEVNTTNLGVLSADYLLSDPGPNAVLQYSDDFTVPDGEAWQIQQVQFAGAIIPDGSMIQAEADALLLSYNVQFFEDGLLPTQAPGPGPLIQEFRNLTSENPNESGSPFLVLPNPITLQPGRYWISVFPDYNSTDFQSTPSWIWFLLNNTNIGAIHAVRDVLGINNAGLANVWILADLVQPGFTDQQFYVFGARVAPEEQPGSSQDLAVIIAPVVAGTVCCLCIIPLIVLGIFCFASGGAAQRLSSTRQSEETPQYASYHDRTTTDTASQPTFASTPLSASNFEINFSDLRMQKKVGEGAYGVVYQALWRKTECAVKQLKTDALLSNSPQLEEFRREAELMGQLKHPNVIQTLGVVTHPKHPLCIVTEFFPVGSLWGLLASHPPSEIDPDLKLHVAKDIAKGMIYLHEEGIVHRDLAARNILLTEDYRAKITDFGMSRTLTPDQEENATKSEVGPLKWMAPESISNRLFSKKSDSWMFGVVMYEMIAHELPYGDMDPLQAGFQVASGNLNLKNFPKVKSGHPLLVKALNRCLMFQPEDRPHFTSIIDFFN